MLEHEEKRQKRHKHISCGLIEVFNTHQLTLNVTSLCDFVGFSFFLGFATYVSVPAIFAYGRGYKFHLKYFK